MEITLYMKFFLRSLPRAFLFLALFCLGTSRLSAQTLNGAWYGSADVETTGSGLHNNYMTELVVKQVGNKIEGVFGYYFRDKYQSFFIHGYIDPKTHEVIIPNIPIIYFGSNSTVNNIDCNTKFIGVIINSRVATTLKGHFYHDERYKYLCPDLKVNYTMDRNDKAADSIGKGSVASTGKFWKPQTDDVVVDLTASHTPRMPPATNTAADSGKATVVMSAARVADEKKAEEKKVEEKRKDSSVSVARSTAKADSALAKAAPGFIDADTPLAVAAPLHDTAAEMAALAAAEKVDKEKISESFNKRRSVMSRVLDIESDSVRLSFYDNGEIDGDSISVFVNKQLVLTHQELAAKALTMYLHLDSTLDINEVGMFAENLGKIPPNTALMVITDGKNRYEVFLSSSLTENATVELRRVRK